MHEHWPLNPYDKVISDTLHIKILRNSFILVVAVRYLLIFPYNHLGQSVAFISMGFDFIGAMPTDRFQAKYANVAIDYFMKWVKAGPLATITENI